MTTFDDYISSFDYEMDYDTYNILEQGWNAAVRALNAQNSALTRSNDELNMQHKVEILTTSERKLLNVKIEFDERDSMFYVREKIKTQWKLIARFGSMTSALDFLRNRA